MTNEPPIDPVSVIVTLISIGGAGAMAQIVGPYVVIAAAGLGGAGFGAMRWRKSSRLAVTFYVIGFTCMSLMLTVPFTELLMRFVPAAWHIEGRWMLAPMAALLKLTLKWLKFKRLERLTFCLRLRRQINPGQDDECADRVIQMQRLTQREPRQGCRV